MDGWTVREAARKGSGPEKSITTAQALYEQEKSEPTDRVPLVSQRRERSTPQLQYHLLLTTMSAMTGMAAVSRKASIELEWLKHASTHSFPKDSFFTPLMTT